MIVENKLIKHPKERKLLLNLAVSYYDSMMKAYPDVDDKNNSLSKLEAEIAKVSGNLSFFNDLESKEEVI